MTAFFMAYEDLQTEAQEGAFVRTTNASEAEIMGLELELMARPISNLTLTGSVSYLDAEYTDTLLVEDSDGNLIDANGNTLPHAPEWKIVFGPEYVVPMGDFGFLTLRGDISWTDDQHFFSNNDQVQEAYTLVNAMARFETASGHWGIEVYGRNLTDEEYFTQMGPLFGSGDVIAQPAPPMTWGVRVAYKFF